MAQIASFRSEYFEGVRELWEEVFPNDPPRNRAERAIPDKLAVQSDLLLVAVEDEVVIGTVMAGYDGHRGWLYFVAVKPSHQRQGIGTLLLKEAERRLAELGCSKVNLQVRVGNEAVTAFYRDLGYEVEERISMGKSLA